MVILSDGSEHHFPATIAEYLIVQGHLLQEGNDLTITAKGRLQAAREIDLSV